MQKSLFGFKYALVNLTYFAAYCSVHSFATVFLLERGFSNTQIGIFLSIANIFAMLLQPFLAGLIDKGTIFTNRYVVILNALIIIAGSILLFFVKSGIVGIFIIYLLIYTIQQACQPFIVAMYFEYKGRDSDDNSDFGFFRGLGSFGFAMLSLFIGNLVEKYGINRLLYANIIIMSIALVVTLFFKKPESAGDLVEAKDEKIAEKAHNNFIDFARIYPKYMVFLLGVIFFFFGHNMLNDYLILIIRNVGGAEGNLGIATSIAAALEFPAMIICYRFIKRFGINKVLMFSGVAFLVKIIILYLAKNMGMIYLSQAIQMFAYAVLIPGAAYYSNSIMQENDSVKGQAYFVSAITIGGIFSSFISGRVIDLYGVSRMLFVGILISVIGVVLFAAALFDGLFHSKQASC